MPNQRARKLRCVNTVFHSHVHSNTAGHAPAATRPVRHESITKSRPNGKDAPMLPTPPHFLAAYPCTQPPGVHTGIDRRLACAPPWSVLPFCQLLYAENAVLAAHTRTCSCNSVIEPRASCGDRVTCTSCARRRWAHTDNTCGDDALKHTCSCNMPRGRRERREGATEGRGGKGHLFGKAGGGRRR